MKKSRKTRRVEVPSDIANRKQTRLSQPNRALQRSMALEREAAEFFRTATAESNKERAAFQKASKKALSRSSSYYDWD